MHSLLSQRRSDQIIRSLCRSCRRVERVTSNKGSSHSSPPQLFCPFSTVQKRNGTMAAKREDTAAAAAASRPATLPEGRPSRLFPALKLLAASAVILQAVSTYHGATASETAAQDVPGGGASSGTAADLETAAAQQRRRRLQSTGDGSPSYMPPLFDELKERRKLMEETPPEEVKYWFEYTGPLQVRESMTLE